MLIYLPDKTKTLLEQHLSHNRCSVTKEQMFVWMNGHCEKFEVYFSVFCIKQNGSPSNGADAALGYIKLHRFITALLWAGAKHSCRRQWAHGLFNFAQGTQVIQRQLDFSELHRTLYGKEVWKKWQLGKILHFCYKSIKLKLQRMLLRILRSVCERCYDIRWSGGRGRKRLR